MNRYATPAAFKEALEARLRAAAQRNAKDQNRLRMRLVMDRFAARVVEEFGDMWCSRAAWCSSSVSPGPGRRRTSTCAFAVDPDTTLTRLQRASRADLHDYLTFEVVPDPRHPTIDVEGMV